MDFLDNLFVNLNAWFAGVLARFLPGWAADLIIMVLVVVILVVFAVLAVISLIYMERKVIGRFQDRPGPNRVGPWGVFQLFADVIKMLIKEDIIPEKAHRWIFNFAAIVVVPPALMVLGVLPFGKGMIGADLNIGLLYVIALGSINTIGVIMAGWGSRNKFALFGAMRAAAQIVSYEVPQVLAVLGVILLSGSLSMQRIATAQDQGLWFIILQPVGFFIAFIASIAELTRGPFDLPEGESEIVAGHHTEYTGLKFGMFFVAEYINAFAVSGVIATLFLGGWSGPILPGYVWFIIKIYFLIFVLMWIRSTLPRLRVDQLMNFAWRFLVPLALGNLLITALGMTLVPPEAGIGLRFIVLAIGNALLVAITMGILIIRRPLAPRHSVVSTAAMRREGAIVQ